MKHLVVSAAGLGHSGLEAAGRLEMAGLVFRPAESSFPAVTCTAQASFRTASEPCVHGMASNGFYSRVLRRPAFWEQSSALVRGPRIWDAARAAGLRVGMYFWQQSMGESVDSVISPAPIHRHGGGMVMDCYVQPPEMGEALNRRCGAFPLHRYWGPLASPNVGRAALGRFFALMEMDEPDVAFLYLPTLDYEAQRHGPGSAADQAALREFERQLRQVADFAERRGADLTVFGDYAIAPADRPPAYPNATLRRAGLFRVRHVAGRAYPDFNASRAFAMCDHEIAHVYVRDGDEIADVERLMRETEDYESVEVRGGQPWAHETAGEIMLVAKRGSWCAYPWWTDSREAPDYATHVDIHNKPGYDPCELFFGKVLPPGVCQDAGRIRGTHGRRSVVAWASTDASVSADTTIALARSLRFV